MAAIRTRGVTVARRVCAGCHRTTGVAVWRWSGQAFVTSHGLCPRCMPTKQRTAPRLRTELVVSDLLC